MAWGLQKKAAPPENEASANKDSEEKKSAVDYSSAEASNDNQTAKKTDPREQFLSKLEQQSNSNTSADGTTTTDMKSDMKDTSDDNISDIAIDTEEDMKQSSKDTTLAVTEKKDEAAPNCSLKPCCNTQKVELPIGDQLLINYLSNYCEESVTGGGSNATAAVSSPSDWLHDIEPSSLSFLKGLAGIKEPSSLPSQSNNDTAVAFNVQVATTVPLPTVATAVTDQKLDTSIPSYGVTNYSKETIKKAPKDEFGNTKTYKIYEVIVPSHVTPGQPFVLKASGVTVRVKCPMNVKTGQKIRFHLPTKLFDAPLPPPPPPPPQMPSQQIMEEEFSDMMALEESMFGGANKATLPPVKMTGIGAPKDDETKPKSKPTTNNNNNNNSSDETSVQNRMLDIIERQQTQLADMQARIDVLGGMMAQMQNDVGYLCHNTWQQQNNNGQQGRQQQQQNRMGGLFGRGEAAPGIVQQLPGGNLIPQAIPAVAHRGQRAPPLHQQQPPVPPQAAVPVAAADAAPRHHQGFFFPLFAALFRFIIDLPQRVRTLLLSTGVGRVYTHLRQEAIARDAFRNIDFGSLIKLVVMLLIFTGRVGGDSGGGRNNRRNQNQEAEGGIFYILLQSMIDYWNGHRVHTLVIASMIAFLIQVGLMSFFYQVLWVERGELLRVWLGQDTPADENEETEDSANDGDGGADQQGDGGGEAREGAANNNNANPPAQRPRPRQRARDWRRHPNHVPPARRNAAQPAAAAEEGIYLFRRGENGGFFHDIQSLFLSFLLSLIPAWRVEEAAEPLPTPEPEPQPAETDQDAASQQPETDGQAGQEEENAGDDDNNEDDGNAAE